MYLQKTRHESSADSCESLSHIGIRVSILPEVYQHLGWRWNRWHLHDSMCTVPQASKAYLNHYESSVDSALLFLDLGFVMMHEMPKCRTDHEYKYTRVDHYDDRTEAYDKHIRGYISIGTHTEYRAFMNPFASEFVATSMTAIGEGATIVWATPTPQAAFFFYAPADG